MQTILLPTDFSDNAWKAASYAANLYRQIPCRYIILHAYNVPGIILEADISEYISSKIKDVNNEMSKIEKAFGEFDHHPSTRVKIETRYGAASIVIANQAKNHFVDQVVMGTNGISDASPFRVGRTTVKVVEQVECPVICVPNDAEIEAPKHIMLATDYNNVGNLDKLSILKEIAQMHDSQISIVHVTENIEVPVPVEDELESLVLNNFFVNVKHNHYDRQESDVESGILNFAHQNHVNLIVILNRDRGFWQGLFHRSITKKLELLSDVPMLILKD